MRLLPEKDTHRTAVQAIGIVLLMGSLAWASIPFYNWFCRVTGFGGVTGVAIEESDRILDETIKVRFEASIDRDIPWDFKPVQREVEIRIGESVVVFYEATNTSDDVVTGHASYNVAPYEAGGFFEKIDCFCFEDQTLQPHQTVLMPVNFFVDPDIVDDREGQYIHTITLGYTFHKTATAEPVEQAALDADLTDTRQTANRN